MKIQKNNTRIQLTLFVNSNISGVFETVRKQYNPEQFALIKSHVTLCREDELDNIDGVLKNLKKLKNNPITITFEEVKRFSEGNGVFVPASSENKEFEALRVAVLKGVIENPRKQDPHITLMHPRNSICTDAIFEEIKNIPFPKQIIFDKIALIEQELGKKWHTLAEYNLQL